MRRALALLLCSGFISTTIGCFLPTSQKPEPPPNAGPQTGDKEHTLEYWGKVREVMRQKSGPSDNLQQVASLVRRQADTVRRLSIDGVDRELYETANTIAHYQEKQLKAADTASYNAASLRADPDLSKTYMDAGQHVTAAIEALKTLRSKLSARYGIPFPAVEEK